MTPPPTSPKSSLSSTVPDGPSPARRVSISGSKRLPSNVGLSLETTVERAQVTHEATARFTVELTNAGPDRATGVSDNEYCHLFDRPRGGSDPAGVWLYRRQDAPTDRVDGRWTEATDGTPTRTYVALACGKHPFPSGATIATTYEVWDDLLVEGYLPTGTYRFETTIPLWDSTRDEGDPRTVEWWLELTVADATT